MRKFYIFALVATMFAACATDGVNEPSATIEDLAPETLTVSFEGEESRIQLQEGKTVWNEDDLVSVFYRSNANQKWQFQGATGDRTGNLKRVEMGTATETINRVVVVYPYAESYYINPETYNVEASLPATQTYVADSYGIGGNIMVSYGEYNQVVLKSVCGWLKLELTGNGESIKSITLKGNNGEQVAGQLYINSADATATLASEMGGAEDNGSAGGNLVFEDTILTEVTLNCGDGVTLSAEPTAFYIALPPQTFENGISLGFIDTDGSKMVKSTENVIIIKRNSILPMTEFEYIPQAYKEIRYTATEKVELYDTREFGANYLSNEWNPITGEGLITFDGIITKVGSCAFRYCTNLTSVTIPNSITSIGMAAFEGCSSLTSIIIPNGVASIERSAFQGCSSLTSITIPKGVTSIDYYTFNGCSNLTSVTIPDSITEIRGFAFGTCCSLIGITLPNGITSIGEGAFKNCNSLTNITIPDGVTEIGNYPFENCSSLESFYGKIASDDNRCLVLNGTVISFAPAGLTEYIIPDSITSINDWAFVNCSMLTSITIHKDITSIGYDAFYGCSSLTSIYCSSITPPIMDYRFSDNVSGIKIYVPYKSIEAYKTAEYWNNYADYIIPYDFENDIVVEIGNLVTIDGVSGVVFHVGDVVKIVSVDEKESIMWSTEHVTTGATDRDNGINNMAIIKTIEGWEDKYPAFKWCADYGTDWYLPAYNELLEIYNNREIINATLQTNNHTALGLSDTPYYWSSSEDYHTYAALINFSDNYFNNFKNNSGGRVRAILAF